MKIPGTLRILVIDQTRDIQLLHVHSIRLWQWLGAEYSYTAAAYFRRSLYL